LFRGRNVLFKYLDYVFKDFNTVGSWNEILK